VRILNRQWWEIAVKGVNLWAHWTPKEPRVGFEISLYRSKLAKRVFFEVSVELLFFGFGIGN